MHRSSASAGFANKFVQKQLGDGVECFKDALDLRGGSLKGGNPHLPVIKEVFHIFDGSYVGKIAFVVLKHVRNIRKVELGAFQVFLEIGEALHVLLHFVQWRIGHKNNSIHAAQNELAGGVINDLARDGIKLEFGFES